MDSKELKELMEYISQSNFVEFEIEREGFKLKLVKDIGRLQGGHNSNNAPAGAVTAPAAAPGPAALVAQPPAAAEPTGQLVEATLA